MRGLLVIVPLLLAGGVGYLLGHRGKQQAVRTTYAEVLPVLTEIRKLLAADPMRDTAEYLRARDETAYALNAYEKDVRAL